MEAMARHSHHAGSAVGVATSAHRLASKGGSGKAHKEGEDADDNEHEARRGVLSDDSGSFTASEAPHGAPVRFRIDTDDDATMFYRISTPPEAVRSTSHPRLPRCSSRCPEADGCHEGRGNDLQSAVSPDHPVHHRPGPGPAETPRFSGGARLALGLGSRDARLARSCVWQGVLACVIAYVSVAQAPRHLKQVA
mmetsp:Transcript_55295/g.161359  ORF Transcript_55295/g.161359 Transcript_55295/m.161359 type:complete len:194 (-) Transcript_55295:53-634(-)